MMNRSRSFFVPSTGRRMSVLRFLATPVRLAVVAMSFSLLAAGASPVQAENAPFSVQYPLGAPIIIDTNAAYTVIPEKLGFWKDEGVEVHMTNVAGGVAAIQQIAAGRGDVTYSGSIVFFQADADSPEIGIRVVAAQAANMWNIFVPEGSAVKTIDDLKGKTIGVQSFSSASYMFGKAAVAASGLDPDKDVKWLVVGVSSQAAQAIQSGTVDAYASYFGPSGVVETKLGKKITPLPTPNDKIEGTLGFAMPERFIKEHPDVAVRFLRGVYKGMVFAAANPSAALQIYWDAVPQQRPRNKSVDEALKETLPNVVRRFEQAAQQDTDGYMNVVSVEGMQKSIDYMYKYGMIKKKLDASKVVQMDLSKKANDFDKDAIVEMAKNWKPEESKTK